MDLYRVFVSLEIKHRENLSLCGHLSATIRIFNPTNAETSVVFITPTKWRANKQLNSVYYQYRSINTDCMVSLREDGTQQCVDGGTWTGLQHITNTCPSHCLSLGLHSGPREPQKASFLHSQTSHSEMRRPVGGWNPRRNSGKGKDDKVHSRWASSSPIRMETCRNKSEVRRLCEMFLASGRVWGGQDTSDFEAQNLTWKCLYSNTK